MANGADAEGFVILSQVRPGSKREFAFAFKAQSEIPGSLGRTRRARRIQSGSLRDDGATMMGVGSPDRRGGKRLKVSSPDSEKAAAEVVGGNAAADGAVSEEEAKSDILNLEDSWSGCLENGESGTVTENGMVKEILDEKSMINEVSVGMKDCGVAEEVLADAAGSVENVDANFRENASLNSVEENNGGAKPRDKVEVILALNSLSEKGKNVRAKKEEVASSAFGLVDVPISVAEASPQKFVKRFTRSALKSKDNAVNVDMADGMRRANGDGGKLELSGTPVKLEMKMSKKIELKRPFVSLKDFLESGLLEGYHVTYYRYSKGGKGSRKSNQGQ